jgi:adenylate cyclase
MLYLVAQGPQSQQRWRRRLLNGQTVTLGRGLACWNVDWDSQISRNHAQLTLDQRRLHVTRLPAATNPVFFCGRQLDEFLVSAGEHFVIGQTRFQLVADRVHVTMDLPLPDAERNFAAGKLRREQFHDAGQRIAVLSQLPDVISRAATESDLQVQIVNVLLTGIRRATTVGIVRDVAAADQRSVEVIHWDQRLLTTGEFQPSGQLIQKAVESGETILHLWKTSGQFGADHITVLREGDWAFVCPLTGESADRMAIYVSGHHDPNSEPGPHADTLDLHDDIKFTELVASTLANVRQVHSLKRKQDSLRPFFSPVVLDAISGQDPETVLSPRECEVSVMFCDLRGFSRRSEEYADHLLELLDRVSGALGVATREIFEHRGVVGDFHGDATMGFWGWPLEQPDRALRACRAALAIRQEFTAFATQRHHPLHDFRIGMGIATGKAVAGRIGTADQVKVTVFGPVVNVAARLESMTRRFRVGILVDQRTHALIRGADAELRLPRVRRLAVVQPQGMKHAIGVSQLLPAESHRDVPGDQEVAIYEQALDRFTDGDWDAAHRILKPLPFEDPGRDFLITFINRHGRRAPQNWPGFIALDQK